MRSKCNVSINFVANIPYYVRDSPIRFKVEPQDQTKVHYEILSSSNITFNCEFSVEPVVSGWYPKIYWYHNGSIVQESEGIHVQSNHWNWTQLSTVYPGSYQCVVNDGYFTTVSRKAWFFLYGTYVCQFVTIPDAWVWSLIEISLQVLWRTLLKSWPCLLTTPLGRLLS